MMLIVGILGFVVFAVSPLGTWLATWASRAYGMPKHVAFAALFVVFVAIVSAAVRVVGSFIQKDEPHEDRLVEIGVMRSEGYARGLAFVSVGVGVFSALLMLPDEMPRVFAGLTSLLLAVLPGIPLVPSTWPPELERYTPPLEAGEPPLPRTEAEPTDDVVIREYAWSYQDCLSAESTANRVGHSIVVPLRRSVYEEFRAKPRGTNGDAILVKCVRDGTTREVRTCAHLIAQQAAERKLPRPEVVSFVLSFSRDAIPYAHDEETHGCSEYCNFPIETLYERRGDCEDHAILTAALLIELEFDTCLVTVDMPGGNGHVAVAVHNALEIDGHYLESAGRRYYYCEATPAGEWRFGEVPPEYLAEGVALTLVPIRAAASRTLS